MRYNRKCKYLFKITKFGRIYNDVQVQIKHKIIVQVQIKNRITENYIKVIYYHIHNQLQHLIEDTMQYR